MSRSNAKSRPVAVLLSALVCPGAGQLYKRHYTRGAVLVSLSLTLVAAVVYRTFSALMPMMLEMQPGEALLDVFGLTHRVFTEGAAFFTASGYALAGLWVVGVLDAALTRPEPPRGQVG